VRRKEKKNGMKGLAHRCKQLGNLARSRRLFVRPPSSSLTRAVVRLAAPAWKEFDVPIAEKRGNTYSRTKPENGRPEYWGIWRQRLKR